VSRLEAEIAKVALNCFVTTKIAFANAVGDVADAAGADPGAVLGVLARDPRIGPRCLGYGHGFGGPCLPRDNRALRAFALGLGLDLGIGAATDAANAAHLEYMFRRLRATGDEHAFGRVSYKPESTLLEESQPLALAARLALDGCRVTVSERARVADELRALHPGLFAYDDEP
jgi:UDP-glucose 6-dehydrogenase